jgi:alkylation response protein AidB-like acyl-CoA dehydrogenase
MMSGFNALAPDWPSGANALRKSVRAFLRAARPEIDSVQRANSWSVADAEFSRQLGAAGFIGMTWPSRYGGHDRSLLERYTVLEELLAAGAPVGMHWIADRQTGPLLLRFGTEQQRQRYLPGMSAGEIYACIGMSEPGTGSDLASVRTRAVRTSGGWRINGQKLWTTNAHHAHLMIALVRTGEGPAGKDGLTQFLIDLSLPGVRVNPIIDLVGRHDFNEVFLDDVCVGDDMLIGEEGTGWQQVNAELALERSGPERYLSSFALLVELIRFAGPGPDPVIEGLIGRLTAETWTLRQMSMAATAALASGKDSMLEAVIVKDSGNSFEQELPRLVRAAIQDVDLSANTGFMRTLAYLLQASPSFSLRGGTREILRGIIARSLGLR